MERIKRHENDKHNVIRTRLQCIKLDVIHPDEHALIQLPDDRNVIKALLCDAMSSSPEFAIDILYSIAGVGALLSDDDWERQLYLLSVKRNNVKKAIENNKHHEDKI